MKISDLLNNCYCDCSDLEEVKKCHPKQIVNTILPISVWKICYSYNTQRGNSKEAVKYIFKDENLWDGVENDFQWHITDFNEKHLERKLSNVEILDIKFLGQIKISLE